MDDTFEKAYFSITCSCGEGCVASSPFSPEQLKIAQADPVDALHLLPAKEQKNFASFYSAHQELGHDPEPSLVALSPLPAA